MSWVIWLGLGLSFGAFILGRWTLGLTILLGTPPATVLVGSALFALKRRWGVAVFGLITLILASLSAFLK